MSAAFAHALRDFVPPLPLAIAYSGGADSSALLRACAQRWPGQVRALHVHHIDRVVFQVIIQAGFTGLCQFGRCEAHNVLLK